MYTDPRRPSFARRFAPAILLTVGSLGLLRTLDVPTAVDQTVALAAPTGSAAAAGTSASASASSAPSAGAQTVLGPTVRTRFGPVQVQAAIDASGTVVQAQAVAYPTGDRRSAQISSRAVPRLDAAAVAAGSAHFDGVSGATYTSRGYMESLQAAIDAV